MYGAGSILAAAGMPSNYQTINHKSYIQTIPALDGKLGLKYTAKYKENKSFCKPTLFSAKLN